MMENAPRSSLNHRGKIDYSIKPWHSLHKRRVTDAGTPDSYVMLSEHAKGMLNYSKQKYQAIIEKMEVWK